LLQDSLGGSAKTVMIATVSPSAASATETVATLKFAETAMRVMQRVSKNSPVNAESDELV